MEIECESCKVKLTDEFNKWEWYIDQNIHKKEKLHHLCGECRERNAVKFWKGETKCVRCYKSGEWGRGKWNNNCGHVRCASCGDVCHDCHELLHYNK